MSTPSYDTWQQPPAFAAEPQPQKRSPRLGRVALVLALVAVVGAVIVAIVVGILAVPYTDYSASGFNFNLQAGSPDPGQAGVAILSLAGGLIGTVIGVWAFIQGIVATAQNRGRGAGIAAIVIAVLGPGLMAAAELGTLALGR